jgi:hypothetical protein
MLWEPDIIADVVLLPTHSGGRQFPLVGEWFGCPLIMPNGDLHDGRLDLSNHGSLAPGDRGLLPIKFLYPEDVMVKITVGSVMQLWEMQVIGSATVSTMRRITRV